MIDSNNENPLHQDFVKIPDDQLEDFNTITEPQGEEFKKGFDFSQVNSLLEQLDDLIKEEEE
jgi:hypothetical protein